jgi:hypothetical protein
MRDALSMRVSKLLKIFWLTIGIAAIAGFLSGLAEAEDAVKLPSEKTLKVIYNAAKKFDVDANDLLKIAFVESSFREHARRVNSNGTIDLGMFQINSIHWSTTCKSFDVFTLKGNAACAAKLLKAAAKHAEKDEDWKGRYHSKTPSLKSAYADKLAAVNLESKE